MTKKLLVKILPGLGNSGPAHWQSLWEQQDPLCTRVNQDNWETPSCADWVRRLDEVISSLAEKVVLAAHSSSCALVAHWAKQASPAQAAKIAGALLVAPSDPDGPNYPAGPRDFGPVPELLLPFPSIVVASSDDIYIDPERARRFALSWGSRFVLLEAAGHINASSGFGPWPEGYLLLESMRLGETGL